jgi:hypothetical protein
VLAQFLSGQVPPVPEYRVKFKPHGSPLRTAVVWLVLLAVIIPPVDVVVSVADVLDAVSPPLGAGALADIGVAELLTYLPAHCYLCFQVMMKGTANTTTTVIIAIVMISIFSSFR